MEAEEKKKGEKIRSMESVLRNIESKSVEMNNQLAQFMKEKELLFSENEEYKKLVIQLNQQNHNLTEHKYEL
jgi:hypothetical protein